MKKFTFILLPLLLLTLSTQAMAGAREDFKKNVLVSANNYYAYPDQNLPKLTKAPKGYKPFYMNHYGRHGSRWLINPNHYHQPVQQLELADKYDKLTPRGKEVLAILHEVEAASKGRLGELSDVGAEQHQGIAKRMFLNFPEIFAGDAPVDAKSTVVIRCILSMQNETDMLKSLNPKLRITTDASEHDMYYMNFTDSLVKPLRQLGAPLSEAFGKKHVETGRFLSRLINDSEFARDSLDGLKLMCNVFDIAGNMQSHHAFDRYKTALYDLFDDDDVYNVWSYNNVSWYILSGETPITKCRVDYAQANLLRNFIESADKAIAERRNQATLRFGHESVVLPLVCLMGINGMDYRTDNLEEVCDNWQCYKVFPMACNLQWVFYRNDKDDDILVKFLLNEHEATLPVETEQWPYYEWSDVRDYLTDKLNRIPDIKLSDIPSANEE